MFNIFDNKDNISNIKKSVSTPSLNQGINFKKYQNKMNQSLERNTDFLSGKEGFTGLDEDGLTSQTKKVITDNDYSNQQQLIYNLRQEYDNTLQQYEDLKKKLSGNITGYIDRVNPQNPYLNKVISFTTGQKCYVTNQGVVKWIPSRQIWKTLNIPQNVQIKLNIPWQKSYSTPGTQIPTVPPLVSGTNVIAGQGFGYEGSNVFVNQLLPPATDASSNIGIPENMGKLAFIDANSNLHTYPNDNQMYSNTYTIISNSNTLQGNIDGAAFGGATLDSCENTCNLNSNCAGFVFDGNTCYPKNNTMFPYEGTDISANGVNIYVRDKIPASPPIGVTQNTFNIDTIKYNSYNNVGSIKSEYGLAKLNSVKKQNLDQLQTKLNLLSSQIKDLTDKFGTGTLMAVSQGNINNSGINNYVEDIKDTNKEIKTTADVTGGGLQNIVKDSDIVVLQKNYDYLFWSILAAGTVLVSMNIVKNQ